MYLRWLLVVSWIILMYAFYRIVIFILRKKRAAYHAKNLRFLQIKIPKSESEMDKSNDVIQWMKQNIEVMNQLYKNFYAISSTDVLDKLFWQPSISCELLVERELLKFILAVPKDYLETFEKVISSFYPGAVVDPIPQPKLLDRGKFVGWWYFVLAKNSAFPIKIYENFEVDPMDSILSSFARVERDERLVLQLVVSPLSSVWQKKMRKKVEKIKKWWWWIWWFITGFFKNSEKDEWNKEENNGYSSQQIGDVEKKAEDEGFNTVIRVLAVSPEEKRVSKMINDLKRSMNQYSYIWLNSFVYLPAKRVEQFAKDFTLRLFSKPIFRFKHMLFFIKAQIFNIKELASLFHFPHYRFNKNPRIVRQKFKIVPAPDNLSTDGIILGDNLYGWVKKEIRLWFKDRFRHLYIIGQTGTGKSTILRTMLNQDMAQGHGFTLIDPHGDLAEAWKKG